MQNKSTEKKDERTDQEPELLKSWLLKLELGIQHDLEVGKSKKFRFCTTPEVRKSKSRPLGYRKKFEVEKSWTLRFRKKFEVRKS